MLKFRNKKEHTESENDCEKKPNAWKKYGALLIAGVLLTGVAAESGVNHSASVANAKEKQEVTLNIADDAQDSTGDATAADNADTAGDANATNNADAAGDANAADNTDTADDTKAAEDATETETETEAALQETYEALPSVDTNGAAIVTMDVSDIVESCMPSIVSITKKSVEEVETYLYGKQEFEAESAASGIIVAQNDTELLVATNSHVVDGATELTVCFTVDADNHEDLVVPAKIKGTDKSYELAVVAVKLSDIPDAVREQLRIAKLGSSDKLKVGQSAIAIGNALGYGQSVTSGIISAMNREITINDFSQKVLLTDATINFGNSGGALLNDKGQVIGINVAKEAGNGSEGMGYSIPIDTAVPVLQRLINKETRDKMDNADRGYMGATVVNVSADAKDLYNMPEGAFVYEVAAGSAAEEAGIKKGDVITKFDGESVTSSDDLIDKMGYFAAGETVKVEVQTANNGEYESREVEVTLKEGDKSQMAQDDQNSQNQQNSQDDPSGNNQGYGFDDGFQDYNNQWNGDLFPFMFGN